MTTSPTSFLYFPKLPTELRLRIYEYAASLPRIIELAWSSKARTLISLTRNPALLHTCHESRHVLLPRHKYLSFSDCNQIILVDFQHDAIFFGPGCRHLVPSGKSNPWVTQNRKVIHDIVTSSVLRENLSMVAFDYEFLLGIEDVNYETRHTYQICDAMEHFKTVAVIRQLKYEDATTEEKNFAEPLRFARTTVVERAGVDNCLARLVAYLWSRGGKRKFEIQSGRLIRK
ncbi:hypothetical protein EG329_004454 [Mollisiaceae sp. DMI_Dod_QoI]|nr:hypothetical protein EG329_004454 [Helotiales sp. DMI_Dod_QoI]